MIRLPDSFSYAVAAAAIYAATTRRQGMVEPITPKRAVVPAPGTDQHWCLPCGVNWAGDLTCWSCGSPGKRRGDITFEQTFPLPTNCFTPSWETAKGENPL